MEFIPGRPLDYGRDLETAARIFARIHSAPVTDSLIVQADPMAAIADESIGLVHRFADHPLKKEQAQILSYHDTVQTLAAETRPLFQTEPLCLVNTEVNSGNFLIRPDRGFLVDWERPWSPVGTRTWVTSWPPPPPCGRPTPSWDGETVTAFFPCITAWPVRTSL